MDDGTPTLSQRLAHFVYNARYEDLEPAAVSRAKRLLGYHLSLAYRALRTNDRDALQALGVVRELSEGCGTSRIIGCTDRATLVDAAMMNCTLMRAQGLDDVIFPAGIHPGLMTYPIALTIGERAKVNGKAFLSAIVVAYEILGKFGSWTWSLATPRRATMPFGPFGGISVASRLLQLTEAQTAHAFGYAAHTAMGLAEGDAGPVSHYYGLVCRNAIAGTYLAKAGGISSATVLEGPYGFLETFLGSGELDSDRMIASLGHDSVILDSVEKRYPGTALNQVPIELARGLIREYGLTSDHVASIEIAFPEERRNFAAGHMTGPFQNKSNTASSAAFQVGMLFLDNDILFSRYEELTNPAILGVVDRTRFVFERGRPIRYARVVVTTKSGEVLEREADRVEFEAEDAATRMRREVGDLLSGMQVQEMVDAIEHFEDLDDIGRFFDLLVPRSRKD